MKAPPMKWIIARGGFLGLWTDGKTRQSETLWYPILGFVAETLENDDDGGGGDDDDDDDSDESDNDLEGDDCAEEEEEDEIAVTEPGIT